jgi:hypothetical protein
MGSQPDGAHLAAVDLCDVGCLFVTAISDRARRALRKGIKSAAPPKGVQGRRCEPKQAGGPV